jgi:hypothetical protein
MGYLFYNLGSNKKINRLWFCGSSEAEKFVTFGQLRPLASSSSYMDRRRSHVAAGPSVRLGL